jgi:hypothetical protein
MIAHDAALLLAAGAALDDLEPDEQAVYESHRAGCAACGVAEDELAVVLSDLALVVPERVPPPDLLAGIRRAIEAEDGGVRSSASAGVRLHTIPAPRALEPVARGRRTPWGFAGIALAAALAVVAVGLGALTTTLRTDLDRSQATIDQLRAQLDGRGAVLAAALDPGHVTVALHPEALAPNAEATVVYVPGTSEAWMVARGLPATPPGTGYQLWYADEAGVHGLQTVAFDGHTAFVASFDVDLATSDAVMLTLEPAGGAIGDPGPQVVFGEL